MSTTKRTVELPNGSTATFHQGHIKSGNWHGYVYVAKHRVYGSVRLGTDVFVPSGSHAHLVQPTQLVEADIETAPSISDTLATISDNSGSNHEPLTTEDDRFALSRSVN